MLLYARPTIEAVDLVVRWNGTALSAAVCRWEHEVSNAAPIYGAFRHVRMPHDVHTTPFGLAFGEAGACGTDARAWPADARGWSADALSISNAARVLDGCDERRLAFYDSWFAGESPPACATPGIVIGGAPVAGWAPHAPVCYWGVCPSWILEHPRRSVRLLGFRDGAEWSVVVRSRASNCASLLVFAHLEANATWQTRSASDLPDDGECIKPSFGMRVFSDDAAVYALGLGSAVVLASCIASGLYAVRAKVHTLAWARVTVVQLLAAATLQLAAAVRSIGYLGNAVLAVVVLLAVLSFTSERLAGTFAGVAALADVASGLVFFTYMVWQVHIVAVLLVLDNRRMLDGALTRAAARSPAVAFALVVTVPAALHAGIRALFVWPSHVARGLGGLVAMTGAMAFVNLALVLRTWPGVAAQCDVLVVAYAVALSFVSGSELRAGMSFASLLICACAWAVSLLRYDDVDDLASLTHAVLVVGAGAACAYLSLCYGHRWSCSIVLIGLAARTTWFTLHLLVGDALWWLSAAATGAALALAADVLLRPRGAAAPLDATAAPVAVAVRVATESGPPPVAAVA